MSILLCSNELSFVVARIQGLADSGYDTVLSLLVDSSLSYIKFISIDEVMKAAPFDGDVAYSVTAYI